MDTSVNKLYSTKEVLIETGLTNVQLQSIRRKFFYAKEVMEKTGLSKKELNNLRRSFFKDKKSHGVGNKILYSEEQLKQIKRVIYLRKELSKLRWSWRNENAK